MPDHRSHHAWRILISCCALQAAVVGMFAGTLGLFLYPISRSLYTGLGTLALYITIMNVVKTFLYPFCGKLFSRYNIRAVLSISILGIVLTMITMSQFTHVIHFYIAGFFLGIFIPIPMFLAVPVLINNWFKKRVGFLMGLAMSFTGIGAAVSNALGGVAISAYGWRSTYIVLAAAIALLTLPFTLFVIRLRPSEVGLKAYGEEDGEKLSPHAGESELPGVPYAAASRSFSFFMVLAFGILMGLVAAMQTNIPAYAGSIGLDTIAGGSAVAVISVGILIGKLSLGFLNDRLGSTRSIGLTVMLGMAGMILLLLSGTMNTTLFMTGSLFYGIAIALVTLQPPLLVRELFGSKDYTSIFSLVLMGFTLSSAISVPLYGFIYDLTGTYALALKLVLLFYLISFVVGWLAVRHAIYVNVRADLTSAN